ncbi:MAG: phosphotransferase family protein [Micromonosporaceae bacterium]
MTRTAEIPYAATAVRPGWDTLPAPVRELVADRLGAPVVRAVPAGGGFTGGFAAIVEPSGGAPVFVKAAGAEQLPVVARSYRQEAEISAALPQEVPAPPLRWSAEVDDWVVLCFQAVAGRMPKTPCDPAELARALASWAVAAEALSPAPEELVLPTLREAVGDEFALWRQLAAGESQVPVPALAGSRIDALAELESAWCDASVSDSAIHCDLRLDNVILDGAGTAWICDWNWPCLGAPWFDTIQLLLVPYGLGADADALLRGHPTTRGVAPEQIDAVLAGFAGAFFDNAVRPPIAFCSPYLRAHQQASGDAALRWLAARRGWR